MGYISVEISETVDVDVDEIIDQLDDDTLLAELKERGLYNTQLVSEDDPLYPEQIIDWFDSPFVSDFDKMQVLNKIKDDLILEIDYIKSNL